MPPQTKFRPLFTLQTGELIGRRDEEKKLHAAIDELQKTDHTLLFYIAGDGGMGKTRLLQWVSTQDNLPQKTFCTSILDFYNSLLRTDIDLVEQIYNDLEEPLQTVPEELKQGFENYTELRDRFHRRELGAVGGDTRTEVIKAFVDAWTPLAEAGYRMVVLLDTAELLRFQDDDVRKRFDAPEPVATAKKWILDVADDDRQLPGTLFVVAGRKKESVELYNQFCERAEREASSPQQRIIDLSGLTEEGVSNYFEEVEAIFREQGFLKEAQDVHDMLEGELYPAFFHLTQGSPITLAIALQLFIDGDSTDLPELLNEQLDTPNIPVPDAQERMQAALVDALANQQSFGEMSIVVRYMALARKGLTAVRFRHLLDALGIKLANVEFDNLFEELRDQIFIKQLPDGSLVLHDKVAEWTEHGLYTEGDPIEPYNALVAIYQREIDALNQEIDRLIPIADPTVNVDEIEHGELLQIPTESEDPYAREQAIKLQRIRRQRRNLVIDQMTYALRGEPVKGFKMYYELAEEAFNVGRMDYETQIRSEFLGWWLDEQPAESQNYKYRQHAIDAGLSEKLINADFAIRAAQRTYSIVEAGSSPTIRSSPTKLLVDKILETVDAKEDPFDIPPYSRILLNIYADMARGQLAETHEAIEEVREDFDRHIAEINQLLQKYDVSDSNTETDLNRFLSLSVQAFAYYERGFFESNHGNHGEAIRNFTRSLRPYRELGFEVDQARSLNDRAFSLAVIGNSQDADTAINDALTLRKRLGFSYPIGLSYNTRGIVHALSDRPVSALQNGYNALRIFQSLSDDYGQMLAYRSMAESMRRDAERVSDNRIDYHTKLLNALRFSEISTQLAENLLTDRDAFKVDVLIEHGSIWRDLARLYWQYPDLYVDVQKNPKDESIKLFERGIKIAREIPGARASLIDAMLDLAYLRYYEIFADDADISDVLSRSEQAIDDTLQEIPAPYRDLEHPDHAILAKNLSVFWSLLCKAYGLRVTVTKEMLLLSQKEDNHQVDTEIHKDNLLKAAILTLYFRSLLSANVRNVRRANQVVYEALQGFNASELDELHAKADKEAESLGLSCNYQETMRKYLEDNFGI